MRLYPQNISDVGGYIEALIHGINLLADAGDLSAAQADELFGALHYAELTARRIQAAKEPADVGARTVTVREVI